MIIYKTTNLINGKIYIGKHNGNIKSYLGSGKWLKRAIKKYGRFNFIREVLEDNIDNLKTLNEREMFWIAFYNSTNPNIGYNITKGGDGGLGKIVSEETRKKISEATKGSKNPNFGNHLSDEAKQRISDANSNLSEERRNKMSESRKNIPNAMKGKTYSQEIKEKMSNAAKQRRENNPLEYQGKKINFGKAHSIYVGVSKDKDSPYWVANISKDKVKYYLGYFKSEEEAAEAYNKKAIELYGENARLNIIIPKNLRDGENNC
jgi:hypothetical protein